MRKPNRPRNEAAHHQKPVPEETGAPKSRAIEGVRNVRPIAVALQANDKLPNLVVEHQSGRPPRSPKATRPWGDDQAMSLHATQIDVQLQLNPARQQAWYGCARSAAHAWVTGMR